MTPKEIEKKWINILYQVLGDASKEVKDETLKRFLSDTATGTVKIPVEK